MFTTVACTPTLAGTAQVKCHSSKMKPMKAGAVSNFYYYRNKSITILTEWLCVQLNLWQIPNPYIHYYIKMYLFNQSKLLHESTEMQVKYKNHEIDI